MSIGPAEILVILVVALIVFGPKKLPEVGRQVGAAMRELRRMQDAVRSELDGVLNPDTTSSTTDDPNTIDVPDVATVEAPQEPDHTTLPPPPAPPSQPRPAHARPPEAQPVNAEADGDRFSGPSGSFN